MKKILCFGDSNTFGYIPATGERFDENTRWTSLLGKKLGTEYKILEEGLNNRNGFFKNPQNIKLCGVDFLPIYLQNHKDIDICILALGTNDAQFFYNLDNQIVQSGLDSLTKALLEANSNTKVIIIPPVKIEANILNGIFSMQFDLTSVKKISETFDEYKKFAQNNNFFYLDLNDFVKPSEADGLHFSAKSHQVIADVITKFIVSKGL